MSESIASTNPRFWIKPRKVLMEKILAIMGNDRTLSQMQLEAFIRQEHGERPPREWLKRLASVLEELKDGFGFDIVIPAVPLTAPRPSILPVKAEEFAWLDGCKVLEDTLWDEWFAQQITAREASVTEALAFGLAFTMVSEIGMHSTLVTDALASLQRTDLLDEGKLIKLRVHPRDRLERYAILALPASARLLLHAISHQQRVGYLLMGPTNAKLKARRERTRRLINRHFQSLKRLAESRHPGALFPPDWQAFCRVAHLLPFYEGLEPFLITAVRRYPLPVAHPVESSLPLRRQEIWSKRKSSFLHAILPHSHETNPQCETGNPNQPNVDPEQDWCGRSKTVLRRLIKQLESVAAKKIRTDNQKQKAFDLIDQALETANRLAPDGTSALHLALFWMREYLQIHNITASTIKAYFQRAFINGLLNFADSCDLSTWDAEDHELAIETMLNCPRLSEKSKQDIIDVLRKVYSFAERHGFCQGVSISFAVEGWTASSTRPEIIGLHRFDSLVRALIQRKTRHDLEKAATLILGFYGGLRSGEVVRLTLNDVVCLESELHIDIHRSKTSAGRRRVPLHLLAPGYACRVVERVYKSRLSEFRENSTSRQLILRNIPLFGPDRSRDRYTGRFLAQSCITEIKHYMGQHCVYHSLRHSFASWLLLRWYAARYPDFLDMIAENNHPVFSNPCQHNLALLFASEVPGRIPEHHASDLVTISKLMGHSGQETLFSTYVHTFHLIHEHAMHRMSAKFGARRLNGKTISAIVPNMKYRHSHLKLPARSINGICNHLNLKP